MPSAFKGATIWNLSFVTLFLCSDAPLPALSWKFIMILSKCHQKKRKKSAARKLSNQPAISCPKKNKTLHIQNTKKVVSLSVHQSERKTCWLLISRLVIFSFSLLVYWLRWNRACKALVTRPWYPAAYYLASLNGTNCLSLSQTSLRGTRHTEKGSGQNKSPKYRLALRGFVKQKNI